MSLMDMMSGGVKFVKIHVDEIRPNALNFYSETDEEQMFVDDMAKLIQKDGQDANGVAYEDISIGDGKKYTLISGERRWKAIQSNFENGIGDGLYEVKIIPKPENQEEEIMRIVRNNAQRNKSSTLRKNEVEIMESVWNTLKDRGEQPEGKKRDWIARQIGLSPRRVQDYLSERNQQNRRNENNSSIDDESLQFLKKLKKYLKETTGRNVRVSMKNFSITFVPNGCEDILDLLDILGLKEGFEEYENN